MSVAERTRYINVFKTAYDDPGGELKQHVDHHLQFFSRGLHNNGVFLPWHRGCVLSLENILQEFDCRVTVPYWNWSLSSPVQAEPFWGLAADQFSASGAPGNRCVDDGPFGYTPNPPFTSFQLTNGRCLKRRITGGSAASTAVVNHLVNVRYPQPGQYDSFRNRLEHGPGLHDSVHCIVGGTMCSARAANDPIFFSHHANIDRIWYEWQKQSPAHESSFSGVTPLNSLMPASPWTPAEMLDIDQLPPVGGAGPRGECSVRVVYQDVGCGPNIPCGAGEVCVAAPARTSTATCEDDCPECTGICVPDPSSVEDLGCDSNADCGTTGDQWCRPAGSAGSQCTGVQLQDEACNCDDEITCPTEDFAGLRCGAGLQCSGASSEELGTCIKPCDETCKFANGLFCSLTGSCREIGNCHTDLDCEAPGNTFEDRLGPTEGFGLCVYSECKSECGDRKCLDLAGVSLGDCTSSLGWGKVWGECQLIQGCPSKAESLGIGLFESESQCKTTCVDYSTCMASCSEACSTDSCIEACVDQCDCKLR